MRCSRPRVQPRRRREPFLHGGGVAVTQGSRSRQGLRMVEGVKRSGSRPVPRSECSTAAKLERLKSAGLDYYNHNLDTSPEFYGAIITHAHLSGSARYADACARGRHHVCCGGIVGMGESREDRIGMIATLASLPEHPESVPINMLVRVAGTPLPQTTYSIRSSLCAPSLSPASPCRPPWCGFPPGART